MSTAAPPATTTTAAEEKARELLPIFRFAGRYAPGHSLFDAYPVEDVPASAKWVKPTGFAAARSRWNDDRPIPYYAEPQSSTVTAFAPATDCNGLFMSYKCQAFNNCYAYACNIASNSFAQPGRYSNSECIMDKSGKLKSVDVIVKGAIADGLIHLPNGLLTPECGNTGGHRVALMYSEPDESLGWSGDYHWCREDSPGGTWSQKDGADQITNFDFAGHTITDPRTANWTVNQGTGSGLDALVVSYTFYTYFWVPNGHVHIL